MTFYDFFLISPIREGEGGVAYTEIDTCYDVNIKLNDINTSC